MKVELATGGTKTITGKHILLAVGGKPVKAPIPGSVRASPCLPGTLAMDVMINKKILHCPCDILVLMSVVALLQSLSLSIFTVACLHATVLSSDKGILPVD